MRLNIPQPKRESRAVKGIAAAATLGNQRRLAVGLGGRLDWQVPDKQAAIAIAGHDAVVTRKSE